MSEDKVKYFFIGKGDPYEHNGKEYDRFHMVPYENVSRVEHVFEGDENSDVLLFEVRMKDCVEDFSLTDGKVAMRFIVEYHGWMGTVCPAK